MCIEDYRRETQRTGLITLAWKKPSNLVLTSHTVINGRHDENCKHTTCVSVFVCVYYSHYRGEAEDL